MAPPDGYWQTPPGVAPQVKKTNLLWKLDEILQEARSQGQNRVIYPGNTQTPYPLVPEISPPSSKQAAPKQTTTLPTAETNPIGVVGPNGKRPTAGDAVSGAIGSEVGLPFNRENLGILAGPLNTAIGLATNTAAKLPVKTLIVDVGLTYLGVGISKKTVPSGRERFLLSFPALYIFGELITPPPAFTLNDEGPTPTPGNAALTAEQLGQLVLASIVPNNPPDPKDREPTPPMWMADP